MRCNAPTHEIVVYARVHDFSVPPLPMHPADGICMRHIGHRRRRARCLSCLARCILLCACLAALLTHAQHDLSPLTAAAGARVSIRINRPAAAYSYAQDTSVPLGNSYGSNIRSAVDSTAVVQRYSSWTDTAMPDPPPASYVPRAPAPFALPPPAPRRRLWPSARRHRRTQAHRNSSAEDAANTELQRDVSFMPVPPVDEAAWEQLADTCVEHTWFKYTYRVCPFRNVTQRVGESGPTFVLGVWHSFHYDVPREQLSMHFTDGAPCAGGQQRQAQLFVRCLKPQPASLSAAADGSNATVSEPTPQLPPTTLVLRHVLEGQRCSYTARLYTPLVCGRGYRTSARSKELLRAETAEATRSARTRGRRSSRSGRSSLLTASPSSVSSALVTALQQHHRQSLQSRLHFHATLAAHEKCIRAAAARRLSQLQRQRETATASSSSVSSTSASSTLLQRRQQHELLTRACDRFLPATEEAVASESPANG